MRVCFAGARRLGLDCLAWLNERVEVVGGFVPADGWWMDEPHEDLAALAAANVNLVHPEQFTALKPDLVVSVLTPYIFTPQDLAAYPAVNLHPAPLPQYRGCNSYAHAIMNGDDEYGVTLHYVESGIDTGPIIGQRSLPILPRDTGRALYDGAQREAYGLFTTAMPNVLWAHGHGLRARADAQDACAARYYPRTSLVDKRTHPDDEQRIRALTFPPHPAPELTTDVPVGHGRDL